MTIFVVLEYPVLTDYFSLEYPTMTKAVVLEYPEYFVLEYGISRTNRIFCTGTSFLTEYFHWIVSKVVCP